MRRMSGMAVLVAFVVLLSGCPVSPEGDGSDDGDETGDLMQADDLFVLQEDGTYQFKTNDSAYWGTYGYTLWAIKGNAQSPFTSREILVNKISGDSSAGYGVVFCEYDSGDPDVGETMLVVMINTKQEYIVGEVTGTQFSEIVPWTTSSDLKQGYNQGNTLRIAYDSTQKEYTLHINAVQTATFRDDEAPFHSDGGSNGYIVVISPLDDFPKTPVHVIFKE